MIAEPCLAMMANTAMYQYKAHIHRKVSSCSFHYAKRLDQIKTFGEKMCCRAVKIDKIFGVTYRTLLSNATTFRNDCKRKWNVQMKHIS